MYSRKRLVLIGCVWLLAGAAAFAVAPDFAAFADDRGCSSPPCAFPAENNMGGIIMGTETLEGEDLVSFGYDGNTYVYPTPPNRVESNEEVIGLGINQVSTGRFFVYKSWYYYDSRAGERVPVNIWINADSADLSGSNECGNGNNGFEGASNCDLLAYVSELSAREMYITTDCVSGLGCFAVPESFTPENYHSVNVEDDTCSAFEGLGGDVCLSLISDGGTCVLGTCVVADTVNAYDIMIRAPYYQAKKGNDNAVKTLNLNNAYLEIRYGKAYDRATVFDSEHDTDWQQPLDATYGDAATSVTHTCQGGGPDTNCDIQPGRITDTPTDRTYDNVHQP
jgi:hypothetical protein